VHSDIQAITTRRRENFLFLRDHLCGLSRVTLLHGDLPDSVCPWVFPIFLNDVPCAHLRLQDEGIPAVNWGGVRPPTVNSAAFPDADFLYDNLIFLPIHQDLTRGNLDSIIRGIQRVVAAARQREREVSKFSGMT